MKLKRITAHAAAFALALWPAVLLGQPGVTGEYRIGPKDLLALKVLEVPELNVERRVTDAGRIDLPLLGEVDVLGLTDVEARDRLAALLTARYVNRANVWVEIKEYAARPVTVLGAVSHPGALHLSGRWDLQQAILAAGGLSATAGKRIYILRRAENGLSDRLEVDATELFQKGSLVWNVPIFPSDIINVAPRTPIKIFFLGEVKTPGAHEFDSDERITLLTAIAKAGGLTDRSSRSGIIVRRRGLDGKDQEIQASYKRIVSGKDKDPQLFADDVVIVKESFFLNPRADDQFPGTVPAEEHEKEIDFTRYWAIVVKRWRLIALCVGVALASGFTISALAPLYYRATTVISVERESLKPSDLGIAAPSLDGFAYTPDFLPTQMRLMRSREIVERVVKRLNLTTNDTFRRPGRAGSGPASPDMISRIAGMVQGNVTVKPIETTTLVELSYTCGQAKLAADVVNALAEAYIEWTLESRMRTVGEASQFLGSQIEELKAEIDERERRLLAYGKSKDIVSMEPSNNVTLQKLDTMSKEYTAAVADKVNKEVKYHELQTAPPDAIADPLSGGYISTVRTDLLKLEREYAEKLNLYKPEWPAMQELKGKIARGKQNLDAAVKETVDRAREQAKNEYMTALRREENLKEVLSKFKGETLAMNQDAVEFNNLKVEVATKRSLLDALLKRQSETDVSSRLHEVGLPNLRIVERALVPSAWRIAPIVIFSKYFSLGIVAAFALVMVLEFLDRSLKSLDEVEKVLHLPPLGIIPAVGAAAKKKYGYGYAYGRLYGYASKYYGYGRRGGAGPAVSEDKEVAIELLPKVHPRSTAAEAYRSARTALLLSRAGGVHTITVTSGYPGEGKTTTSANLAVVLAQLGKRVLLIDSDLHKPRLHKVLNVSNRAGLVSILAENMEFSRAAQTTEIAGLSFLAAGPSSPSPSELLSSDAMGRLLTELKSAFDFIVIDSPPIQAVSDALILGVQTDGVVLCVKGGRTPRESVARVRDRLLRANVRILGVLINNLVEDATGYGYKYYYYSEYGRGYGYGRREEAGGKAQQAGRA